MTSLSLLACFRNPSSKQRVQFQSHAAFITSFYFWILFPDQDILYLRQNRDGFLWRQDRDFLAVRCLWFLYPSTDRNRLRVHFYNPPGKCRRMPHIPRKRRAPESRPLGLPPRPAQDAQKTRPQLLYYKAGQSALKSSGVLPATVPELPASTMALHEMKDPLIADKARSPRSMCTCTDSRCSNRAPVLCPQVTQVNHWPDYRAEPPQWLVFSNKVLRYYAYFKEPVVESAIENYRQAQAQRRRRLLFYQLA